MKVLISSLKSEPDQTKQFQEEVYPPEDLKSKVSPAQVFLTVTYTGEGVLVTGELETDYTTNCSRCLEPAKTKIELKFQEEFRQVPPEKLYELIETQKERVLDEEELNVDYFSGNELDLNHFLREMLVLALPLKVVCHEECPGLCPSCGKNLNHEQCDCEDTDIDPRLIKLEQLKKLK